MGRPKGKGRAKPMKKISLYDTTLRDGTQSETVSLSVMDKVAITEKLDEFGIHYIEGGYPGSNPKDKEFFDRGRNLRLKKAKLCAFGMTRRVGKKVEEDSNMKALLSSGRRSSSSRNARSRSFTTPSTSSTASSGTRSTP
jgi:isopropylmalate/homocitrate/citramalate synthase